MPIAMVKMLLLRPFAYQLSFVHIYTFYDDKIDHY